MRGLILSSLLALAACAGSTGLGGGQVSRVYVDEFYSQSDAQVFAAAGAPVEIYGAPRGGASPEVVASSMRLPPHLFPSELTATDDAGKGLRLALVFAPAVAATPEAVCAGEAKGGEAGAVLRVYGVYCTGTRRVISEAVLEVAGSPAPGDPAFGRAFTSLFYQIFPVVAPLDQGNCRRPKGC